MLEDTLRARPYRIWPGALTATLALMVSLVVWFAARNAERRQIHQLSMLAAQAIREDIDADMHSWIQDLGQLAKLWESKDGPSYPVWKANAELYLSHHPGCLTVEWIRPDYQEHWLIPVPGGVNRTVDLREPSADLLQRVARTKMPQIAGISGGNNTWRHELIAVPVFRHQVVDGFVVALLDVKPWLDGTLADVLPLGYSVTIRQGETQVFSLDGNSPPNQWQDSEQLSFAGQTWNVTVWPKPVVMNKLPSKFPQAMLLACVLLGAMLTLAVHLVQVSASKSASLQEANQQLTAMVEEVESSGAALRASEARLAGILENSADGIVCVSEKLVITLFNGAAGNMFGYKEEEVIGQHLDILIPERFRDIHRKHIAGFASAPQRLMKMSGRKPIVGLRKDGTEFPMDAPLSKVEIDGENVFTVSMRDITERMHAEEQLQRSHDELERRVRERTAELLDLSNKVAHLQEEERRRIARELHDGTTQILLALNVDLGRIGARLRESAPDLHQKVADSRELVKRSLDELRTVSYLLHPPLLDELGFDSALRNYVKGFSSRSDIDVDLQLTADVYSLRRDIQVAIFRIVQESLTNIHRHSGSRVAKIKLWREDVEIRLEVADRGKGMAPELLQGGQGDAGIGLASMRERVRQLGGRFQISGMGGTIIQVALPLHGYEEMAS